MSAIEVPPWGIRIGNIFGRTRTASSEKKMSVYYPDLIVRSGNKGDLFAAVMLLAESVAAWVNSKA